MSRQKKKTAPEDHPVHYVLAAILLIMAMIGLGPEVRPMAAFLLFAVVLMGGVSVLRFRGRRARALALRDLQTLTPRELELHVAQVLGALPGWKAEATRGSGDQGADVIATTPTGARVAVQVKHYRNNVGNKAVQEIVASKALYGCTHAVVFTSGPGYTKAAHELARANSVPLWSPDDLFRLQDLAAQGRTPPITLLPA